MYQEQGTFQLNNLKSPQLCMFPLLGVPPLNTDTSKFKESPFFARQLVRVILKSPFLLAGGSSFNVFESTNLSSSRYSIETAPASHSGSVLSRYLTVKLCKGSTAKFHLILSSFVNPFMYSGVKKSLNDSPLGSLESTSTNARDPEKDILLTNT